MRGFRCVSRPGGLQFGTFLKRSAVSIALLTVLASNLTQLISTEMFKRSVDGSLSQMINSLHGSYLVEVRFEEAGKTMTALAFVRGVDQPTPQEVADMELRLAPAPGGTRTRLRLRFVEAHIILLVS